MTAARRHQADVMVMPANLTARRGSIPQIVTILDVNFLTQPGTYERTFVRYATWAYRRSLRDANAITTISAFSRGEIAHHLDVDPDRIAVVYPGLDPIPPLPPGGTPHSRPYALYVGSTERHKNVGLLLDAWAERSPAGLDLAVVGQPGRDHTTITRRALATSGRVAVIGRVSGDELERWYRHASVFVFPSRVEGFGYPPLEAMSRGVPVVSSGSASLREVLRDGALYVDPDRPAEVAAAVERILGDELLRSDLIARGIATATLYTWVQTAALMAATIHRIAPGSQDQAI